MSRKSGGTTVAGSKRGSSMARKTLPVAAKADLETPAGAETAVHIMGLTDAIQLDRPTRFRARKGETIELQPGVYRVVAGAESGARPTFLGSKEQLRAHH